MKISAAEAILPGTEGTPERLFLTVRVGAGVLNRSRESKNVCLNLIYLNYSQILGYPLKNCIIQINIQV